MRRPPPDLIYTLLDKTSWYQPGIDSLNMLLVQRLPSRPLRGMPRRALPSGAGRARDRVLHPARVERRPPAARVVPRELEIVALARHADDDPSDARPGVQPGAEGEHAQIRVYTRSLERDEEQAAAAVGHSHTFSSLRIASSRIPKALTLAPATTPGQGLTMTPAGRTSSSMSRISRRRRAAF